MRERKIRLICLIDIFEVIEEAIAFSVPLILCSLEQLSYSRDLLADSGHVILQNVGEHPDSSCRCTEAYVGKPAQSKKFRWP